MTRSVAGGGEYVEMALRAALGIDVGSTSVKACLVRGGTEVWSEVRAHDGDVAGAARGLLRERAVPAGTPAVVTGGEGRRQFRLEEVIPAVALEQAIRALELEVAAVVSVGGEDLAVYALDQSGRIVGTYAGNKCASGTGEFFAQQLARMDLTLDVVHRPEMAAAEVQRLSSRCSVFMKSDCTHKLNKGEADRHDIALSLSHVMARKVLEFVAKARLVSGRVLLCGGAMRNPHLVRLVRQGQPSLEFVLPRQAAYLEAVGAAHIASERGRALPPLDELVERTEVAYARGKPLGAAQGLVTFVPSRRGRPRAGGRYVLGIDGGSTTTKVALVDMDTREVAASHYGRTLGDPVAALRTCLRAVRNQLAEVGGEEAVEIRLAAATGSSRELLGVYGGTAGIYNEIIAHTVGSTSFDPAIDTIFEIGGQDAKYVHLQNRVPVDYAMNEACSAGTGSFLEESAAGDLDVRRAEDIGPMALQASAPLRFGEHCSAFINSDIRKAIQQGASREDIVAGLCLSVVANYLNRVVGNRRIGSRIVLQGGVAKNPAVPLAFAQLLGKPVVVPPDPELMGAYGVALLALRKREEGALEEGRFSLSELIGREIRYEKEYRCKSCENLCPIRITRVGESRHHFGGRCNQYANLRRKARPGAKAKDYVEIRRRLYFGDYAAPAAGAAPLAPVLSRQAGRGGATAVVGVPEALGVHSLWPLLSHFFHALGVKTVLVSEPSQEGTSKCESSFCYPAEIAHGQMGTLLERHPEVTRWLLPHLKSMPSLEREVHACFCPITQGLPYYLRTAFGLDDARILRPVLDFSKGLEAGAAPLLEVALRLGFTRRDARAAFARAAERQRACEAEARRIGREALAEAAREGRPAIVLFGRPYNAFAPGANMGIPRKFATRGYTVIPFDFLPTGDEAISPNMYWWYGQQDLKAAVQVRDRPDLFACFVTSFSCAPDSFILHFNRWIHGSKPFLTLELDSHTADAGVDTRVEAFLDIIEGWRRTAPQAAASASGRDWDAHLEAGRATLAHRVTGERLGITDPRVRLVWPSMGRVVTQFAAGVSRARGIRAVALEPAKQGTAARARAVASGKECIPALLVLGSFLEHLAASPPAPDGVDVLVMPKTTGPCRTGQYAVFYQGLFEELGWRNVVVMSPNSDSSYAELGHHFNRELWKVVCVADYLRDAEGTIRALARDREAALAEVEAVSREMIETSERGADALLRGLERWAGRLSRIPLVRPLAEARRALVVGEIFVRRDDFSVEGLVAPLAERGVVAKVTGLSEWIHYLDWDQVRRLQAALRALPPWRRALAPEVRRLLALRVEMAWKACVERRVRRALGASGLVPESPHGMDRIMARAGEFASPELESEATLSPASAALAMEQGYDGAAIIAPFACLPGRLIDAVYGPWARARGLPVVAVENDGNPYPPGVVSRIEIFAHNVSRASGNGMAPGCARPAEGGARGSCAGCGVAAEGRSGSARSWGPAGPIQDVA